MPENAVVLHDENTQVAHVNPPSENLSLFERAMDKNYTIEQIEKLYELQKRHERDEAQKAYHRDMALFKKEEIKIPKDKFNAQYKSNYTSLGVLLENVVPFLGKHHFSHRWDIQQEGDNITVECISTHEKGHQESVKMVAPPDKSGSKNIIQQIKSTRTYLQSATFESLYGLAATDANTDDDGNGSGSADKPQQQDMSKLSPEYKALMETKALFHDIYSQVVSAWGEPINIQQYKQLNDEIKRIVDDQNNK